MANTVIALKKSATPSAVPAALANGELAINYADGKLFYKAANGTITSIATGTSSFGTINANSTLVLADQPSDVLTLIPANSITMTGDAINDTITIGVDLSPANNWANNKLSNTSGVSFAGDLYFPTGNVAVGASSTTYKLFVNGSFAANTKSFVIDHPTKPGMKLRYGSLEGPENGVYVRGRLDGTKVINLPDYWEGLVDMDTITVNLTSIGRSQNLYVSDIDGLKIYIDTENHTQPYCFYHVYAERKDVAKLIVEF